MGPSLSARGVTKAFRHRDSNASPTFRAWVAGGFRRHEGERRKALDDVSLAVSPGEMLGVIGRNGSGKSTLLRLLGGVMRPDSGTITSTAPVKGLLDLNAGMHPDLTGRDNIFIGGILGGLLRSEVAERLDAITEFAGLSAHIDQPVRTYSSGMKLRLGFGIAAHLDPRILLIDEVLAVGDLAFQEKCLARIDEFREKGCAIVLITHDLSQVRARCNRVLWLDAGRVKMEGAPDEVVDAYEEAAHQPEEGDHHAATQQFGVGGAKLDDIGLFDADDKPVSVLKPGDALSVRLTVRAERAEPMHLSVSIAEPSGRLCFDANSLTDRIDLPDAGGARTIILDIDRLDLAPGPHAVSIGLWKKDWSAAIDMRIDAVWFDVSGGPALEGVMSPPRRWRSISG